MNIIGTIIKFIVVAALVAVTIPLCVLFVERQLLVSEPAAGRDVIIVLGSAAKEENPSRPLLRSRVEHAVLLWKAGFGQKIIFSGGEAEHEQAEADVMARIAGELGVPAGAEILERTSRSTKESAIQTAAIMTEQRWKSALVVTSPYHTRRAKDEFTKSGIQATVSAAPYPPEIRFRDRVSKLIDELKKKN